MIDRKVPYFQGAFFVSKFGTNLITFHDKIILTNEKDTGRNIGIRSLPYKNYRMTGKACPICGRAFFMFRHLIQW